MKSQSVPDEQLSVADIEICHKFKVIFFPQVSSHSSMRRSFFSGLCNTPLHGYTATSSLSPTDGDVGSKSFI